MTRAAQHWQHRVRAFWQHSHFFSLLLLPLSIVYGLLLALRRWWYGSGIGRRYRASVPVVVVGGATVGGAGKTPTVLAIAEWLVAQGWRPAIVSRGYRGKRHDVPHLVNDSDTASDVGDEALLLRQSECEVIVCRHRVRAVQYASARGATIIISDDGLQHLRMRRDVAIICLDAATGIGNGRLLPAGPLREPRYRLQYSNCVLLTGSGEQTHRGLAGIHPLTFHAPLVLTHWQHLSTGVRRPLSAFAGQRVHVVCAIALPQRFIKAVQQTGAIIVSTRCYADHAPLTVDSLPDDELPVVVSSKDAVKLPQTLERVWLLQSETQLDDAFTRLLAALLPRAPVARHPSVYRRTHG